MRRPIKSKAQRKKEIKQTLYPLKKQDFGIDRALDDNFVVYCKERGIDPKFAKRELLEYGMKQYMKAPATITISDFLGVANEKTSK